MNHYDDSQHEKVAKVIKKIKNLNWIISYDNTPVIEKIYQ